MAQMFSVMQMMMKRGGRGFHRGGAMGGGFRGGRGGAGAQGGAPAGTAPSSQRPA